MRLASDEDCLLWVGLVDVVRSAQEESHGR